MPPCPKQRSQEGEPGSISQETKTSETLGYVLERGPVKSSPCLHSHSPSMARRGLELQIKRPHVGNKSPPPVWTKDQSPSRRDKATAIVWLSHTKSSTSPWLHNAVALSYNSRKGAESPDLTEVRFMAAGNRSHTSGRMVSERKAKTSCISFPPVFAN